MKTKSLGIITGVACAVALAAPLRAVYATDTDDTANTSIYFGLRVPGGNPDGTPFLFTDWNDSHLPDRDNRCRSLPPSCATHETHYLQGFQEAISGRRYGIRFPVQPASWVSSAEFNPNDPERQACQGLDGEKLRCCRRGYAYGVPALSRLVERTRRNPSGHSEIDRGCLTAFDEGTASARQLCRSAASESCPSPPARRQTFLGCFHAGLNSELANCSGTGSTPFSTAGSLWLRYSREPTYSTTRIIAAEPEPERTGTPRRHRNTAGNASDHSASFVPEDCVGSSIESCGGVR